MRLLLLLIVPVLIGAAPDYAHRQLDDPALEREAVELMRELRCLTCEGQSIAESDADLAGDMRHLVRSRLASGERPAEVRGWLIDRYGSAVSYRPPGDDRASWPLYAAPFLLLAFGLWLAARRFGWRRRGE